MNASKTFCSVLGVIASVATVVCLAAMPCRVHAQTVIDDWASIKAPSPPELKSVTVDPSETAFLVLDFNGAQNPAKGPCNTVKIPRCIASIPRLQKFLAIIRANQIYVVYSVGGEGGPEDIATAVAPHAADPIVKSGPDKFVGTNLAQLLSSRNIKTVIITGTASEGAVLDTATDAALKGLKVIVPVDGMSSSQRYAEQYVAWHLTHAIGLQAKTTLTRFDMIHVSRTVH